MFLSSFLRHLGEQSEESFMQPPSSFSRRSLHDLVLVAARGGSKVSHINIIVLLQLLQVRQDSLLDEILALWRGGRGLSGLLHLSKCLVRWQTTQCIDQNGIRLGNIEANVRNLICDQPVQDGKNGAFNDIKCNDRGKSLGQ